MSEYTEQGPILHDSPAEKDVLIRAMEAAGYTYDGLESTDDHLRFFGDYGQTVTMAGWQECEDWLNGVVFDDPDISDHVEQILHPERFSGAAVAAASGTRTLEDMLEQNDNQLDGIVNNLAVLDNDPTLPCREAGEAANRESILKLLQERKTREERPSRPVRSIICHEEERQR